MIDSFKEAYAFLSNFYSSPVRALDGTVFPTVEHAYQWAKSPTTAFRTVILGCKTPGEAKKAGRRVRIRTDWEEVKVVVMRRLIELKFAEDTELARMLLATGDEELVEGNWWGDQFWGVCGGVGQNWLGRLLMERREQLR